MNVGNLNSISISGNSILKSIPSCKYRLPCGRCDLTKQMCSEQPTTQTITISNPIDYNVDWTAQTSSSDIDTTLYTLQNSTTAEFLGLNETEGKD